MTTVPAPYLGQVEAVLPQLLALFDVNPISPTLGYGDRLHWGWKLIDFPNAAFQGIANGLSRLVVHGLLPQGISEASILLRIGEILDAVPRMLAADGSVGEAYPNESSFCVTALVLFDSLVAIDLLGDRLPASDRAARLAALAPMAAFLERAEETHGFISNHLATGAAAMLRYAAMTATNDRRGREILKRIVDAQSTEGWFPEYGGADPGYQTLCLTYLTDIHRLRPDLGLAEPLRRAVRFVSHAAHPDGSFAGLYGWRGTRILAPAPFEALAGEFPEAASMARFARRALAQHRVVPLTAYDAPNMAVMFNGFAWAAAEAKTRAELTEAPLPCEEAPFRRHFPEAGMVFDRGDAHYTVVGWRRGGVVAHFPADGTARVDAGVAMRHRDGRIATTQGMRNAASARLEQDAIVIDAPLEAGLALPPNPAQFAVLRMLCATVLKYRPLNELFKRMLVRRMMLSKTRTSMINRRRVTFGPDAVIADELGGATPDWSRIECRRPFSAIHMASQGYWQRQDDCQP